MSPATLSAICPKPVSPNPTASKPSFRQLLADDSGQDLIEYALVGALVALGAVTAMNGLATKIGSAFSTVGSKLSTDI